jgi:hypothetical protein
MEYTIIIKGSTSQTTTTETLYTAEKIGEQALQLGADQYIVVEIGGDMGWSARVEEERK